MQLAICWSGSSHLQQWRQNFNCSSHIVTQFMGVLCGVIYTNTLLENLLSVIVTHSNNLLMSPDTPARVWHLRWTQLTISMWCTINLLSAWWAEWQLPPTVLLLPLSILMYIISLHWWLSGRVCYMHRSNRRTIMFQYFNVWGITLQLVKIGCTWSSLDCNPLNNLI